MAAPVVAAVAKTALLKALKRAALRKALALAKRAAQLVVKAAIAAIAMVLSLSVVVVLPIVLIVGAADPAQGSCAPGASGGADDPVNLQTLDIATRILLAGQEMGMDERQIVTGFAVALVESGGGVEMKNVKGSPGDPGSSSTGVFQQKNTPTWTIGPNGEQRNRDNVEDAARSFFEHLRPLDHGQKPGDLAADVQRPAEAYAGRYALAVPRAQNILQQVMEKPDLPTQGLGSITAVGTDCGGPVGPAGEGKISTDNDLKPPPNAPPRVVKVIEAANQINDLPYVWGGGHGSWVDHRGYDCSGSVGFALHVSGFVSHTMVAAQFSSWGVHGNGHWITVYSNDEHVFMYVAGKRFDTSSYERVSSGRGPRWRSSDRPTAGFTRTHPEGL